MKWIKCSERMPEKFEDVLFFDNNENCIGPCHPYHLGYLGKDLKFTSEEIEINEYENITHWMPLPHRPNEEDNIKN